MARLFRRGVSAERAHPEEPCAWRGSGASQPPGPWRRRLAGHRGSALALLLLSACALPPAVTPEDPPLREPAEAEQALVELGGLSVEQHQTLRAGGRVEEFVELDRQGQRYVGGVSYALVRAEPRQVLDVLNRLDTLSVVLPSTRSTRVLERSDDWVRVEIEQGNSVVSTTFTVFFQQRPAQSPDEPSVVRFWLDPSQPHGIDDVWGFFRASRYDSERALVSVGALVNLGPGLIRMLFEERIQRAILRMPNRIRDTVERTYRGSALPSESVSATAF